MSGVSDRVRTIVAEHSATSFDALIPELPFRDVKCDSIDHVEIVLACEEHFAVEITDDEWQDTVTVGELITLVERKLAEHPVTQ